VYGIAVDGIGIDLLVVVEDAVAPKRSGSNDMSVCEYVPVGTMRAFVSLLFLCDIDAEKGLLRSSPSL
jgi:hypothetical protein